MIRSALLMAFCTIACLPLLFAQSAEEIPAKTTPPLPTAAQEDYQPTPEKLFNLKHVELDVRFDYQQRRMPGKAILTLSPHFYPQSVLRLDAKGMLIHKVALVKGKSLQPLRYDYADSMVLVISLDRSYTRHETLQVQVEYTARPNEVRVKGSAAITDAKGLYFINPDGKDSTKPIQIWTQGETEATSVWCPIIDKPNQKTTQQISMTVPAKYVTLSNGVLTRQVINNDGTRTDTWKMDLPHAPYLFFMGVGDYAIIKDKYKNIPVDYYVEKEYAPLARQIFGDTPAMMAFFGKLLGMEYPWPKYAQMVGRDYVSGAMENTTSTLHGTGAYQNARQLKDGNRWEIVVAHELFHQWFGDLVTAESWGQLTVNESFADYSEYLWLEHKYGKDHALAYNHEAMQGYFGVGNNITKHLVRFTYDDKEEMFDGVSYQKGGRIQNMLRQYVGDSAYFAAMQLYLQQHRFKSGEAHQWRLALEEVSGKDLNWFFDQWYFSSGHPIVRLKYLHNDSSKTMQVVIQQQQKDKIFYLPVDIDVYTRGKASRMTYWTRSASDTISIAYDVKPEWINVDPQRMMLWEKQNQQDHQQWLAQARYAKNHLEKLEVIEYLSRNWKEEPACYAVLENMLKDEYAGTRKAALNLLRKGTVKPTPAMLAQVKTLATKEKDLPTRAYAIDVLALDPSAQDMPLFAAAAKDSSYSVAAAGLEALARIAPDQAMALAPSMKEDAKGRLLLAVKIADYLGRDTAQATQVIEQFRKLQVYDRILEANAMLYFANRLRDLAAFRKATGMVLESYRILRTDLQGLQSNIASTVRWMIRQREQALQLNPGDESAKEQLKYLKDKSGW